MLAWSLIVEPLFAIFVKAPVAALGILLSLIF